MAITKEMKRVSYMASLKLIFLLSECKMGPCNPAGIAIDALQRESDGQMSIRD
jgi:hypothetical protein